MASRDLTSAFLERRSAANMRRRNDKNGYGTYDWERMPKNDAGIPAYAPRLITTFPSAASGPSKKLTAGGSDDLLLAEVRAHIVHPMDVGEIVT